MICWGLGAGAAAQAPDAGAGLPGPADNQITPQTLVHGLRSQLPIALEKGVIISGAVALDHVTVELTIGGANWPDHGISQPKHLMPGLAERTVTAALCGTGVIANQYLKNHQVIYLNMPSTREGPARYKLSGDICSERRPRAVEVAMALPELPGPTVVHYSGKQLPATFQSCADWENRLLTAKPNNAWLVDHKPQDIVKGEFETTEAYELRRSEQQRAYVNLAIPIDPSGLRYDADSQIMKVDLPQYATLQRDVLINDSYVGTNSFGAMIEIERAREKIFSVQFENARAVLPDDRYIPMTIESAKALKTSGVIRVLGLVTGHDDSYLRYRKPSLDDPRDEGALHSKFLVKPFCVAVVVDGKMLPDWQEF